jgi:hypothetical protein
VLQARAPFGEGEMDNNPFTRSNTGGDAGEERSTDPNPPYGGKAAFRKLTMTLPQWAYEKLVQESARRKIAGQPNQLLSALVREAVAEYLNRLDKQPG